MSFILGFRLQDIFFYHRRKDKVIVLFEMKTDILGCPSVITQDPFSHDLPFFRAGYFGGYEACLVSEVYGWYLFIGACQGSNAFKVVDDEIVLFYRQVPDLLPDPQWGNLAAYLPVIKTAAAGVKKAKALTAVFDRSIELKTIICAAQENVHFPISFQVREELHCPADMAVTCCLYCVKNLHKTRWLRVNLYKN